MVAVFSGFYRSIHRHPRFGWVSPLTPKTYDAPEAALVANISARVAGDNDWFLKNVHAGGARVPRAVDYRA